MRRLSFLTLGVALASLLAACDVIQGAIQGATEPLPTLYVIPTLEGAAQPGSQPGGTPEPGSEGIPDSLGLNAANQYGEPSGVSSYRVSMAFNSTVTQPDGTQSGGSVTVEGVRQVDPPATSMTFSGQGDADFGAGNMTFVQLEGVDYIMTAEGECLSFASGQQDNPYSILMADGGVLGELNGARPGVPPIETVNGVLATHYVFDQTSLAQTDPTTGDIQTAQGDVWTAVEGGYVVRLTMTGQGTSTLLNGDTEVSDISYALNYSDFNQPVDISLPEGCQAITPATSEYPMLPDATGITAAPGLTSYTTQSDMQSTADFYKAEMAASGYTLDQEFANPDSSNLSFNGPAGAVMVTLAPDPVGGGTTVAIFATG